MPSEGEVVPAASVSTSQQHASFGNHTCCHTPAQLPSPAREVSAPCITATPNATYGCSLPQSRLRTALLTNSLRLCSKPSFPELLEGMEGGVVMATRMRQSLLKPAILSDTSAPKVVKKVHYSSDVPSTSASPTKFLKEAYVQPLSTADKKSTPVDLQEEKLPATYFSAHLLSTDVSPLHPEKGVRVVAKVDSGCSPYTIISSDLVQRANLLLENRPTSLRMANKVSVVNSMHMVTFVLRVMINMKLDRG